jgi:dTDP-glucose 4,6-dehydratase
VPPAKPPDVSVLLAGRRRILVTGGAGFNCCSQARGGSGARLLSESEALVLNLDKCGYASDLTSIEALPQAEATSAAAQQADPDMDLHLAAESNVSGTFHLLQAVRTHWEGLSAERQAGFRFHHISTDEVFGSLGATGRFSETTPYAPRSPYSASKAASAHQLQ